MHIFPAYEESINQLLCINIQNICPEKKIISSATGSLTRVVSFAPQGVLLHVVGLIAPSRHPHQKKQL
jgi:hypothetical protein